MEKKRSLSRRCFLFHSRLLEKIAKLNSELGEGNMTVLPIVKTWSRDIPVYILTNVISITDGKIFLSIFLMLELDLLSMLGFLSRE